MVLTALKVVAGIAVVVTLAMLLVAVTSGIGAAVNAVRRAKRGEREHEP
jgi:Na+-transporting methylmalonyl-CoA/oxaloacetate decarboxylase gamma subunit